MTDALHERNRRYLTAMAVVMDMLKRGIIDETDYTTLEAHYAASFRPLLRYERPCCRCIDGLIKDYL